METNALTDEEAEALMREALAEAARGMAEGEVPIGAVLARRGPDGELRVVGRGSNRGNARRSMTAHAEIVAFEDAGPDNAGLILVTTMEPCVMCYGAAIEAGVARVVYGIAAPANGAVGRVVAERPGTPALILPAVLGGVLAQESRALLAEWLRGKEGTAAACFVEQLLASV